MPYTLQFNKTDTLAATLLSGATSTTLTTGNFGSPSGTQIYVVDYDVPAKAEIISATIANTAVTGVTRGLTGGAAGTTDHQIGAKIASIFVPQHYEALAQGTGFASGTASVGIPAASMKLEAYTAHTSTLAGYSGTPTQVSAYTTIGNTVIYRIYVEGTSNATTCTMTLPFAAKVSAHNPVLRTTDNGVALNTPGTILTAAGSATANVYATLKTTDLWTASGTKRFEGVLIYERA